MSESWTNKYISVPFVDKGRSEKGCDCWGLARLIYQKELGIDLPALLDYRDTLDRQTISNVYESESQKWQEISLGDEKPFDLIVLKMMGFPMHVGIVFKSGFMIHCLKDVGTVVVNYKSRQWVKRIVGFYRYDNASNKTFTLQNVFQK